MKRVNVYRGVLVGLLGYSVVAVSSPVPTVEKLPIKEVIDILGEPDARIKGSQEGSDIYRWDFQAADIANEMVTPDPDEDGGAGAMPVVDVKLVNGDCAVSMQTKQTQVVEWSTEGDFCPELEQSKRFMQFIRQAYPSFR